MMFHPCRSLPAAWCVCVSERSRSLARLSFDSPKTKKAAPGGPSVKQLNGVGGKPHLPQCAPGGNRTHVIAPQSSARLFTKNQKPRLVTGAFHSAIADDYPGLQPGNERRDLLQRQAAVADARVVQDHPVVSRLQGQQRVQAGDAVSNQPQVARSAASPQNRLTWNAPTAVRPMRTSRSSSAKYHPDTIWGHYRFRSLLLF